MFFTSFASWVVNFEFAHSLTQDSFVNIFQSVNKVSLLLEVLQRSKPLSLPLKNTTKGVDKIKNCFNSCKSCNKAICLIAPATKELKATLTPVGQKSKDNVNKICPLSKKYCFLHCCRFTNHLYKF